MKKLLLFALASACFICNAQRFEDVRTFKEDIDAAYNFFPGAHMENLEMKRNNCRSYKRMLTTRDNGIWYNSDSVVYTYDNQNRVTSFLEYQGAGNSWILFEKGEMKKDDKGNPSTTFIYQKVDSAPGWRSVEEKDYLFDSLGTFSVEINKFLDRNMGKFRISFQRNCYYDESGNDTDETVNEWGGISGTERHKRKMTYDQKNYLLSQLIYNWETDKKAWRFEYGYRYEHDAKGNLLRARDERPGYNMMERARSKYYSYDAFNREVEEIDSNNSIYYLTSKTDFSYDSIGDFHRTLIKMCRWDLKAEAFKETFKTIKTYNSADNLVSSISMSIGDTGWQLLNYDTIAYDAYNKPLHFFKKYWEDTQADNGFESMQIFYYYHSDSTANTGSPGWHKIILVVLIGCSVFGTLFFAIKRIKS